MARITTPPGTIRINRTSRHRPVDFDLVINFTGEDTQEGHVTSATRDLNLLVDDRVSKRSHVTAEVIQEAMDAFFEQYGDSFGIEELHDVKVIERKTIRKRPYADVYPDEDQ